MSLTEWLINIAIHLIDKAGYLGISLGLIADSCGLPLPSEAILGLSGSLARTGRFDLLIVIIIGSVAQTAGAYLAYQIGYYGGEPFVRRYGKYVLISHHDLDKAKAWFDKHGEAAILGSRLLPIIRTYISFPAGVAGMKQSRFLRDSLLGSTIWSIILASAGFALGNQWRKFYNILHWLDYVIVVTVVVFIIRFIYKKLTKN